MENAGKPYGLSFESADVVAVSLGIQIKDYELIPILLSYSHDENRKGRVFSILKQGEPLALNCGGKNVNLVLMDALKLVGKNENLNYICSIKLICSNNMGPTGVATSEDYWVNSVSATGLRLKPKTKTEPPPILTINKSVEA